MYDSLRARGWTKDELHHLKKHYKKKPEHAYAVCLGMLLLAVAVFAIPYCYAVLGAAMNQTAFLTILAMLGVLLGAVFGLLLVDLDRVKKHHHVLLLIAIPVLIFVGSPLVFARPDTILGFDHNPLISGAVYAVTFALPYAELIRKQWT